MALDDRTEIGEVAASLRRQVEEKIRREIVHGRFQPGEHLSDRALCERYKVSRTVVREAVRQLEAERLVESVPNRGSFVKILTVEEAVEIFDTRAVLEAWATLRFVQNATDEELEKLILELEDLKRSVAGRDQIDLIDRKQLFYDMLFSVYKNSYIQNMLNQIQNWSGQLRAAFNAAPDRLPHTIAELERLVSAIRDRDEQGVWQASLERVQNVGSTAVSVLWSRGDAGIELPPEKALAGSISIKPVPVPVRPGVAAAGVGPDVIEILLTSGHRVRVDSSIDGKALRRVINALQEQ